MSPHSCACEHLELYEFYMSMGGRITATRNIHIPTLEPTVMSLRLQGILCRQDSVKSLGWGGGQTVQAGHLNLICH